MIHRLLGISCFIASGTIGAQSADAIRVEVKDAGGLPIPYAMVQINRGSARVVNDSGVVQLNGEVADSLRLVVRRIGYIPFDGWSRREAHGVFIVTLAPLARELGAVTVTERANTPLARTGFYRRMERVRRGATVGTFITPEELDLRNPPRISSALGGQQSVKVTYHNGRAMITGRSQNCPMVVLLDGRKVDGMIEEALSRNGQAEIDRMAREQYMPRQRAQERYMRERMSVDELINSTAVAAIEIYASAASVPPELQQNMTAESCGLIAIWTGERK